MTFKKIAVVTSKESWFIPYAKKFVETLKSNGYESERFNCYMDVDDSYEIVFMLSYFEVADKSFLEKHKHVLVVHESDLPHGKGWAPLFWQILEGKNETPIGLFEASGKVDSGDIYLKDTMKLEGHELHEEIREKQAMKTTELCLNFLENYENLKPQKQEGKESEYKRRTPEDSELDINKSVSEQFNLLRIVNNEKFPAFFRYKDRTYILKIFKRGFEEDG